MGLVGGLALFLFGMEQMTEALKLAAGGRMKTLLSRMTSNRFKAALAGSFVTAVIQSSSVTTVLVVGFISAGLMSLSQSIGIILGANIGTTITAQIIAFKVTHYALLMIAVGFALLFLSKKERIQQYGKMLLGLGLVFFGMNLMSDATRPLRSYAPFINMMQSMDNPWLAMLVSALFTGLVQSSSATTGVIIVLASQGFVTLEAGIALAFGANIGTCVTALLAAIGKPREALQAAMVHIIFNVLGVVIWLPFVDQLADFVRFVSPTAEGLTGMALLAAETPRQIANAHTAFNVANTLIFIWFTTPLAKLVKWLIKKEPEDETAVVKPRYLDDFLLETPSLALDRVRMELRRLGDRAALMTRKALPYALTGSRENLDMLIRKDDELDELHTAVLNYLSKLTKKNLTEEETLLLQTYMQSANNIESIGDMIENNIVQAGYRRIKTNLQVSKETQKVLTDLQKEVTWTVELALQALDANNMTMAKKVVKAKSLINHRVEDAEIHLAARLAADEADRVVLYRYESEIIEYLKRVYYFAKRIAKAVVELEGLPAHLQETAEAVPA